MKTVIKIALIVLAVALIGFVVWHFVSKDETANVGPVAKTEYVKQVADRAEKVIQNVDDYSQVKMNFTDLENEIMAEKANGTRSEEEIKNALEFAIFYFAPKVIKQANEHFSGSEWSSEEVRDFKETAKHLLDYHVIEDSAANQAGLNKVITVADHYAAARQLASSSPACGSADQVRAIMSKANAYKNEDPLKNCTQLCSDLDAVVTRAVNNYGASVAAKLNAYANQLSGEVDNRQDLFTQAKNIYSQFHSLGRSNSAVETAWRRVDSAY